MSAGDGKNACVGRGGANYRRKKMKLCSAFTIVAALFAAFTLSIQPSALADTFGTSGNEFTIDFVNIGNTGNTHNSADGWPDSGAVPYEYRMGKYEISQDDITKATASGMANVTAGAWSGSQPAANISWYEAAAFVNWLNTSKGYAPAYNLVFTNGAWSITVWSGEDAWTAGGTNIYRHKDAFYFLPTSNEWYKAAYYNPGGSNYFLYPTGSDTAPTFVDGGTNAGTAVYYGAALIYDIAHPGTWPIQTGPAVVPASVYSAGGLSPYGTMGQGGNVREWSECNGGGNSSLEVNSLTGTRDVPGERALRGGHWKDTAFDLSYSGHILMSRPTFEANDTGFRVASVPEP
jgi:sulfatase modifying factor 1